MLLRGENDSKQSDEFQASESAFFPRMKNLHTKKTSNGSNFGWLIRQMSINQKSGRKTFARKFVSDSLFVSPCPPECNFQSETKTEPDLRLKGHSQLVHMRIRYHFLADLHVARQELETESEKRIRNTQNKPC